MLKKIKVVDIGIIVGVIIFAIIALNLSVGWFTIIMPIFATIVLGMILLSPDDDSK